MSKNKSKLKKRLRKKHKLGEFQQLGFSVCIKMEGLNVDPIDDIINIMEFENCACGGGGNERLYSLAICSQKKYKSLTIEDRDRILSKIKMLKDVEDTVASDLHDIWHMTKEDNERDDKFYEEAIKKFGLES